ncbi:MAG TPA: flagellar FlbD family protein [Tepidisphaeraceae bacterium]|nr:flagellar FlbD family protein [Tepidisphaeraceae bacterium]
MISDLRLKAESAQSQIANCKSQINSMILLTRLNGQSFVMNAEKIRYVESTPDTIVCCESGEKMMVKEPLPEVMRRAIEYARTIRKPVTE